LGGVAGFAGAASAGFAGFAGAASAGFAGFAGAASAGFAGVVLGFAGFFAGAGFAGVGAGAVVSAGSGCCWALAGTTANTAPISSGRAICHRRWLRIGPREHPYGMDSKALNFNPIRHFKERDR
jgi:hypothetical protein